MLSCILGVSLKDKVRNAVISNTLRVAFIRPTDKNTTGQIEMVGSCNEKRSPDSAIAT